jgi:reactive intermediate/imine deaminase
VFRNLRAVAGAAGATLDDIAKLTILLVDLGDFAKVNEIMATYFQAPYPARATYQVAALPRGSRIEVEAILAMPMQGDADAQTGWLQTFDQTKGQ